MGTFSDFQPGEFYIERRQNVNALVDYAVVGLARVGRGADGDWVEVPMASIRLTGEYVPTVVNGTDIVVLLVGPTTASMSVSYYDDTLPTPVQIFDSIRIRYKDGTVSDSWTLDSYTKKRIPDPAGDTEGGDGYIRIDLSCTLVGPYAHALNTTVCLGNLPTESPADRLKRYGITVSGTFHASDWDV